MKLVIQIPCLNEREYLPRTFGDLPRHIDGIDEIEVLVIDDGSSDGTADVAAELGVHHIVRFPARQGLAAAFMAGIDASLRLGADIIVNTDADNQYPGSAIARLVRPILEHRADVVIGDRQAGHLAHFSATKRLLQRLGSRVVSGLSGTSVPDATSGFRAYNRRAAYRVFVHNRFTYTLETIIQGGRSGLIFDHMKLDANETLRESRLFASIPEYLRRGAGVIVRAYAMYQPVQTFASLAAVLALGGAALSGRFLFFYVRQPVNSGHAQSLVVGVGLVILAFLVGLLAILGDLLSANRRLLEDTLARLRRLDATAAAHARALGEAIEGVRSTGAAPWRRGATP
ncbi:MAG: glycosyltransferase family 2 protein [Myxococcales bacterium]|nr:glycosyltransferase family 2 protein [Myxococcales bacterium]